MEAFLISTGVVALAEVGDKTQLLAFVLAARFRRQAPIVLGILVATVLNHALAGVVGVWITRVVEPELLRWVLGLSFIAMALWVLVPDKAEGAGTVPGSYGVFGATFVAFFVAEMADKTQVATVALAAQYQALTAVVAGTTLGMLLVNVPSVMLGERIAARVPVRLVHAFAAAAFALLGVATLLGADRLFSNAFGR
jgi:Ca2+/H+ antiporter, TMEM165/GDT1 family